jgi:hypothetical protein
VAWQGPVLLIESEAGALTPACSADAGFPNASLAGFGGLSAPPAQCACSCVPTGVTCSTNISVWTSGTNCTLNQVLVDASDGVCVQIGASNHHDLITSGVVTDAGACTPNAQTTLPDASWGTLAVTCATPSSLVQSGCPTNQLCAPPPRAGQPTPKLCVVAAGTVPCPQADYTTQHVYYQDAGDTRGCACTCGPVTGYVCGETLSLYSNGGCGLGGLLWDGAPPTTCIPNAVGVTPGSAFLSGATGGACAPDATPTGTVTGTEATTVCCQP